MSAALETRVMPSLPPPAHESVTRMKALPLAALMDELHRRQAHHPMWESRLLHAFRTGAFDRDDLRFVFSQYFLYSRNFTRYVAAVMANCESDYFRAKLSENLWEEGGGCEPERRHAQIFRNFLSRALGITSLDDIVYEDFTKLFVREYLQRCLTASPLVGAAFLSLGTEGIVARLYEPFVQGLLAAGLPESDLEFFRIHMECDDEHAATLEELMVSYAAEPGWFDTCAAAMDDALTLRERFFESLFVAVRQRRMHGMLDRIQARASLADGATTLTHRHGEGAIPLYTNTIERMNIDFSVERFPMPAEVLDPRMVFIPAGKFNERHRHAHETFLYVLEGSGQVLIDERVLAVTKGDAVMVPRWSMHQTQNLGASEMRILAVTDFNLTEKAYVGDARAYRGEK
jgi:pyrroloquinoline quinone (PQQ) biosynthesis protein C/mannose-6-phosphate isomerase-like protein (cupin superfamily)